MFHCLIVFKNFTLSLTFQSTETPRGMIFRKRHNWNVRNLQVAQAESIVYMRKLSVLLINRQSSITCYDRLSDCCCKTGKKLTRKGQWNPTDSG